LPVPLGREQLMRQVRESDAGFQIGHILEYLDYSNDNLGDKRKP
jgi:hypothetical protein